MCSFMKIAQNNINEYYTKNKRKFNNSLVVYIKSTEG